MGVQRREVRHLVRGKHPTPHVVVDLLSGERLPFVAWHPTGFGNLLCVQRTQIQQLFQTVTGDMGEVAVEIATCRQTGVKDQRAVVVGQSNVNACFFVQFSNGGFDQRFIGVAATFGEGPLVGVHPTHQQHHVFGHFENDTRSVQFHSWDTRCFFLLVGGENQPAKEHSCESKVTHSSRRGTGSRSPEAAVNVLMRMDWAWLQAD